MKISILFFTLFFFFFSMNAQERGKASYYAKRFHNKKTASGIIHHRDSMVCAHKKYPFGTLLKVKNTKNNKEVIVKVTDRGPYTPGRIIDLSYAAAVKLDFVWAGTAKVEVWVVDSLKNNEK